MRLRKLLLALSAVVIAGCATPYQPLGSLGGYSEKQLEPKVYEVTFLGNGGVSRELAQEYWHRRARELCGGDYEHTLSGPGSTSFSMSLPVGGLMVPVSGTHPKIVGIVRCK
ncbi:CC0125/CC1285 family lipoprotein [Paucibacter sp. B51]|jgi:hypothetical protein|uniref:CC0125/CC1285 family lipoprotein n=1 Tax=Paucibacter sp. B51 TaxID=2993315 RepID=UPI003FA69A73